MRNLFILVCSVAIECENRCKQFVTGFDHGLHFSRFYYFGSLFQKNYTTTNNMGLMDYISVGFIILAHCFRKIKLLLTVYVYIFGLCNNYYCGLTLWAIASGFPVNLVNLVIQSSIQIFCIVEKTNKQCFSTKQKIWL